MGSNYTVANHDFLLLRDDEKIQFLDDVREFLQFDGVVQIQLQSAFLQQFGGVLQLEQIHDDEF